MSEGHFSHNPRASLFNAADENGLCDIVDHASEKGVYKDDGISGCDLAERQVRTNVPAR
jgi:hypothetical protein